MIYTPKSERKTRKQLREIAVTEQGSRTDRWQGIQFGELADLMVQKVRDFEYQIAREMWYVNPSETILIGEIDIAPSEMDIKTLPSKYVGDFTNFTLAVRHSNNSRHALTFLVGATIFICSNGVCTGDIVHKRRHTKAFDLGTDIEDAINLFQKSSRNLAGQIVEMAERKVSLDEARILVMRLAEVGLIPWRNVEHCWQELLCPTHDLFSPENLWGVFNCLTEKAKLLGAQGQVDFYRGLYPLVQEQFGLTKN